MAREQITGDNLTPLIQIITWFCLIISIVCFVAWKVTRASLVHALKADDCLITLSLVHLPQFSYLMAQTKTN